VRGGKTFECEPRRSRGFSVDDASGTGHGAGCVVGVAFKTDAYR